MAKNKVSENEYPIIDCHDKINNKVKDNIIHHLLLNDVCSQDNCFLCVD